MKHIREIICKIFYKIGLKNAARRVCPSMYYTLVWQGAFDRLKTTAREVATAWESFVVALNIEFPAKEREEK